MSEKSVSRALLRFGALATAAVLAFGATSAAALAQDDPTSTPPAPTETSTPPTSDPAPPPPPPADEPAQPQQQQETPNVTGVIYADKNRNGQQDPGEEISGGRVKVVSIYNTVAHPATSDADGKFGYRLPAGTYQASYELPDGWVVHQSKPETETFKVVENATTVLTAHAERPYWEQFFATAQFDRDDYSYPATARVTVTLTNLTDRPIRGIGARCHRDGVPNALGRAQGWEVFGGSGVTLGVGDQQSIVVVEEIPLAGRQEGRVTLDCQFVPNPRFNNDGPVTHDEAIVSGGIGNYTMVLGEDRNADQRIDRDEAAGGVKVVLFDPQTGEQAAERASGADGKIEFGGLKLGVYRAVVLGSWAFTDNAQEQVSITEQDGFGYRFLKYASRADIRATVKFDKPRYESHETVRAELTVTNIGGQTAERVRLDFLTGVVVPDEQWGDFRRDGPGIRIPAGGSRTFTVTGKINYISDDKLSFWGVVGYVGVPNPTNSGFYSTVDVVQTTGDVTGVIYNDKNRNGQQDPGEASANTLVEFGGGVPNTWLKVTTDANGRFSFIGVPSGQYWINYTLADGWIVHQEGDAQPVQVVPGAPVQLTVRAERPYHETLRAAVALEKGTYSVGDDAKITIKLTNTGDRAISGIKAGCNRIGDDHHLGGRINVPMPATWGDLHYDGKGVTVGPGETKTIVVTEKVPPAARATRKVIVSCDFEPNPGYNTDGPYGFDWAIVSGGPGSLRGQLVHDGNKNYIVDPGEVIANTRIALFTHREHGALVAQTFTDAEGNARFDRVPPGEYWVWVDGPWKFEGEYDTPVQISSEHETVYDFFVVPGPPPVRPGDGDSGTGEDDDQGVRGVRGALAKTGASVLGLGVVAALLVAFGIGARVAGRRKSA